MSVSDCRTYKCDECGKEIHEYNHKENHKGWLRIELGYGSCEDRHDVCSFGCSKDFIGNIKTLKKGTRGCSIDSILIKSL